MGGKTTRRERRRNLIKMAANTAPPAAAVDMAAIRVRGEAMIPDYRDGDVALYRRPNEELVLRPGDDVLVLLNEPEGNLQLLLRRLVRWDEKTLELRALNPRCPPICEHPRKAVLCGKVLCRLTAPSAPLAVPMSAPGCGPAPPVCPARDNPPPES